ncbi:MAG TPA: DUF4406 domain-containing protein [Geothrix sp.]|nr:DUF4406 domain-containing protein [Geothrix sp.]HJV47743.1 DUF4406 domain-containing protein [Geothrix sp.]
MNRTMEVIYVAGPYSGKAPEDVYRNIQAAIAVGQQVRALGLVPLVPHTAILPTGTTEAEYEAALAECFELMTRCDGMVLMPTWRESPGAVRECEYAERFGLEVFECLEDLQEAMALVAEVADAGE